MSLSRGFGDVDPLRPQPAGRLVEEERRRAASWVLATGTLACPSCDAPVAPGRPLAPADPLECPFCDAAGRVRDFLSLGAPVRPARVEVRVVARGLRLVIR